MKGVWNPSARAACADLIKRCGWPPKAAAAVLGLSPESARAFGERDAPPLIRTKGRLRGMVLRLRNVHWTRKQIAEYLRVPRIAVDRVIDSTPKKPVYRRRRGA